MIDCTGSMQPHINAAMKNTQKIVEDLKEKYENKVRVGFVGYRDYNDAERFIEGPFTTDTAEVIRKVPML